MGHSQRWQALCSIAACFGFCGSGEFWTVNLDGVCRNAAVLRDGATAAAAAAAVG
jgi:hypothetical protein